MNEISANPYHHFKRPTWIVAAAALVLVGHSLLLFNTGMYFDGWMIFDFVRRNNWNEWLAFLKRVGMPVQAYWFWGAARALPFPLGYKIFSFFWIILGNLTTYSIFAKCRLLSFDQRIWIILLATLNPSLVTVIEPAHFCYHSFYFVLQLGAWVFLCSEENQGVRHVTLRLLALSLFFLSFNFNALLTYYYSAWALWSFFKWQGRKDLKSLLRYNLIQRLDYTILPLIFWFWKTVCTPVHGDQIGYNSIAFGTNMLGPLIRLPYVILVQFVEAISNLRNLSVLLLCSLTGVAAWFLVSTRKRGFQGRENTRALLGSGLLLMAGATFPYVAATRGFSVGLNGDRINFLFSFPLAILIVGGLQFCFNKHGRSPWVRVILSITLCLFTIQTIKRYVNWQLRAIKDEAVMLAIVESGALQKATIFGIQDRVRFLDKWDDRYWYIPHQPTFMMAGIGGYLHWIGIPLKPEDPSRIFTIEEIIAFTKLYKISFYTHSVNFGGKQAIIEIQPGPQFKDNLNMFLSYYNYKLFAQDQLKPFLRQVISLNLTLLQTTSKTGNG
ncbi:hypothetical protein WDW86_02180 [Bdellovibrionota bacterium FG-2]